MSGVCRSEVLRRMRARYPLFRKTDVNTLRPATLTLSSNNSFGRYPYPDGTADWFFLTREDADEFMKIVGIKT